MDRREKEDRKPLDLDRVICCQGLETTRETQGGLPGITVQEFHEL